MHPVFLTVPTSVRQTAFDTIVRFHGTDREYFWITLDNKPHCPLGVVNRCLHPKEYRSLPWDESQVVWNTSFEDVEDFRRNIDYAFHMEKSPTERYNSFEKLAAAMGVEFHLEGLGDGK